MITLRACRAAGALCLNLAIAKTRKAYRRGGNRKNLVTRRNNNSSWASIGINNALAASCINAA